jgi:hypothetical protein
MQKRIVRRRQEEQPAEHPWLNLEAVAEVELTSEDAAHPIEGALMPSARAGWRAAEPGAQSIRLLFRSPQRLRRIRLRFNEANTARTQEFVLRWSPDGGRTFHDIVRQQYTFSPTGATSEVEDLTVELASATALELSIIPDQSGQTYASLAEWRIS